MDVMNLHSVKRQSITEIAVKRYGFYENKKKSTKKYPVLENGREEIFVKLGNAGFEVFATRNNHQVTGTIIDFVMNQENCDFKKAVKIIKMFFSVADNHNPKVRDLIPISSPTVELIDYVKINRSIERYGLCMASPYLFTRGITQETLRSKRFLGTIRTKDNIIIFPHKNRNGFCGWEARSPIFKGFCKGGVKGLWASNCFKDDEVLVVAEGAIDAISYYELYKPSKTRFMSVGGRPNDDQKVLIKRASKRIKTVITAFDIGKGGDKLRDDIEKIVNCEHKYPTDNMGDYNECLMYKKGLKK